ncbi:MAG: ABC transporter substrate-binding protein [Acidobacteriota bacterium]
MKRAALALALLASLACTREEKPRPLTKVRMNLNPSMTYAPLVIAKEEGFFAAEGIEAEFVSVDTSAALLALNSRDLDVFSGAVRAGMFNMMLKGLPLRVVADKGHSSSVSCESQAFVAPVKTAERIRAAGGSLRGERVSVARGGLSEYMLDLLLAKKKTTAAEVEFVDLPQGASASFRQDIDAVRHLTEPHLSEAIREKRVEIIATGEELSPGHQSSVLVYGKRLLQDDPELGRRFMRAYLRGVARYNEGKTPRNVDILSRATKLPAEVVRRSCWIAIAGDGRIRPDAVQRILVWSRKRGYLDGDIQLQQWWDPQFIDSVRP